VRAHLIKSLLVNHEQYAQRTPRNEIGNYAATPISAKNETSEAGASREYAQTPPRGTHHCAS
jgi:hypothetical protein